MATAATAIVKLVPEGTPEVEAAFTKVASHAGHLQEKFANTTRRIAETSAEIVDMGKVGASSLSRLIALGSDVAFGFGTSGAIVGAVGIAAGAIVKMFTDSRDEIRKTEQEARDALVRLRIEGSSSGTIAAARDKLVELSKAQDAHTQAIQDAAIAEEAYATAKARGDRGLLELKEAAKKANDAAVEAQTTLNRLTKEQADLAALAAKQFGYEEEARKRLEEIAKREQAATPGGRAKLIGEEVNALAVLAKANALRGDDLERITRLQDALTAATLHGTAAARAQAQAELDKLNGIFGAGGPRVNTLGAAFGGVLTDSDVNAMSDKAQAAQQKKLNASVHVVAEKVITPAQEAAALLHETLSTQFADGISAGITDGIDQGFAAAFQSGSIGKGFAALGAGLVSGLGGAMVQFGKASLAASTLMEHIQHGLAHFLPGGAIVASLAMIALGEAMRSVGGAANASFGNGFGASGAAGITGPAVLPVQTTTIGLTPTGGAPQRPGMGVPGMSPAAGNTYHVTIIGANDPVAQSQIMKLITNAKARGF